MTPQSGKQHLKMLDIGLSPAINITIAQSVTLFKHMVESVMVQEDKCPDSLKSVGHLSW